MPEINLTLFPSIVGVKDLHKRLLFTMWNSDTKTRYLGENCHLAHLYFYTFIAVNSYYSTASISETEISLIIHLPSSLYRKSELLGCMSFGVHSLMEPDKVSLFEYTVPFNIDVSLRQYIIMTSSGFPVRPMQFYMTIFADFCCNT